MKKTLKRLLGSFLAVTMCMNSPTTAMAVSASTDTGYVQEVEEDEKLTEEKEEEREEKRKEENEQEFATASNAKRESSRAVTVADEQSDWVIDEYGRLISYRGSDTEIRIPDNVVCIYRKAFEHEKIRKVIIPEGVEEIDCGAFAQCNNLEEVEFPKSLKKLGTGAFSQCTSLKEIHITGNWEPVYTGLVDGTTYASQGPFAGCSQLKKIIFDEGVTKLSTGVLEGCDGIEEIDLTGIKKIGDSAFRNCVNLKKVKLDPELNSNFCTTFYNCKELTSINIPKNISVTLSSKKGPFYGCTKLSDVTLEKDTIRIPYYLFLGCTGLKTINLSGVKYIEEGAFKGCENLVGEIGPDGKEGVYLDNIEYIREDAFLGCTSLKRVVLGENLRSLAGDALSAPNLTEAYFYDGRYSEKMIPFWGNKIPRLFDENAPVTAYICQDTSIHKYIKNWNTYNENKINFKLIGKTTGFQIGKDNWKMRNDIQIARDKTLLHGPGIIPKKTFKNVLESDEFSSSLYKKYKNFKGYCYGFATTARMFYENPELFSERFANDDSSINVYKVADKYVSYAFKRGKTTFKPTVTELMEYFWASQLRSDAANTNNAPEKWKGTVDEYNTNSIESIIDDLNNGKLVGIDMWEFNTNGGKGGHTVLGYKINNLSPGKLKSEKADDGKQIFVYDSFYPEEERSLLFLKKGNIWIWKYYAYLKNSEKELLLGTYYKDGNHPNDCIQNTPSKFTMDDFETWFSGVELSRNKSVREELLLDTEGFTYKLKNQDTDSVYINLRDYPDANQILCACEFEDSYSSFYYIPDGIYSFTADGGNKLNLRLSADKFSADIQNAEAESATISLNDKIVEENWIILDAANGKNADIAFHSSHDDKNFDEISIKGKGNKEKVTYTLKADGNEVSVDGVVLEEVQITVNEDTEEEKVINLPVKNSNGSTHTVKVSSDEGKTNIQVLDEKNQVIASTDGTSSGGNTGDNQGGSTGDNQGGNTGDNQGGNTGDNQGGNTGDNQGGSTGGSSGSGSGGGSGSSSGGSSGGGSGSGSGGGSGSRRSGGGSSSSASRGILITKPSYYGTGTWESNAASTAWKLKIADGTTLALQWGFIDGVWYLFGMDGYTYTGWQLVNNQWYYFQPNAMMKTGWFYDNNQWYYLNDTGAMQTGWVFYNNQWYYLNDTGAMQTGWVSSNNQWYYLSADGSMLAGTTTPDGYAVGADGVWVQ